MTSLNSPYWSPKEYNPSQEYPYKFTPNGELRMRVCYPYDWTPQDRRPALLFFFGGGWKTGSYSQFFRHAMYFAGQGLVAACAEYRIMTKHESTIETCVADAFSALEWLARHAEEMGIDPSRLIASGGSAGGHLAACVALLDPGTIADAPRPTVKPAALVLYNPVVRIPPQFVKLFNLSEKDAGRLNPIAHVTGAAPPTAMFFGKDDPLIKPGRAFAAKARSLGARVDLFAYDGGKHGFFNRDPWFKPTLFEAHRFLAGLGLLSQGPAAAVSGQSAT